MARTETVNYNNEPITATKKTTTVNMGMFESLGFNQEKETVKTVYGNDAEEKVMTNSKIDNLPQYLKYIERILNESKYHKQYVVYRNYSEINI
jgi:glyceraldehyde-3-phosphate dehydrogenase/erythrose-4-phosphate dehydrogenase